MGRKRIVLEWLRVIAGLVVYSFGVHLMIYANIGLASWECLGMGIAKQTPLNYGATMTIISVLILITDLILHEHIGFGTVFDALLSGYFVQFWNDINPFPENKSLLLGIALYLAAFLFIALSEFLCMGAGQGCGPRDTLLIAISKRLHRVSFGTVVIIVSVTVLAAGFLLGGPIGVGTVLYSFGAGAVINFIFSLTHFKPEDIRQKSVVETLGILLKKKGSE